MAKASILKCPHCRQRFQVHDPLGRRVRCRECGRVFAAPAIVKEPEESQDDTYALDQISHEDPAEKVSADPHKKRRTKGGQRRSPDRHDEGDTLEERIQRRAEEDEHKSHWPRLLGYLGGTIFGLVGA